MQHDITTDELVDALHVIQSVCENNDCRRCPIGDSDGKCMIKSNRYPVYWDVSAVRNRSEEMVEHEH